MNRNSPLCPFFPKPACANDPFPRKLLTGVCFVLRVATSPRDTKRNPAAGQNSNSHLQRMSLAINPSHRATSAAESCGDACLSIPASSPLNAPRIRQRKKRTAPLALSPRRLCFSMSLYPSPPALCSSLSPDAPTTAATFPWKRSGSRCAKRRLRTDSPAGVRPCARLRASRVRRKGGKKFERAHPALCCGVPLCLHV